MKPIDATSASETVPALNAQKKKLKNSCEEFESFMVSYMLKSMRQSIARADEPDRSLSIYEDMSDQAVSKEFSQGQGLGLAKNLYKLLEPLVQGEAPKAELPTGVQKEPSSRS